MHRRRALRFLYFLRKAHAPAPQRQHQRRRQHQRAADDVEAVDPRVALRQHGEGAERDLHRDERDEQRRRPRQFAPGAMTRPDVRGRHDDRARHHERAGAVREVHGDRRAPVIGHEVAEHPWEIRNRESRPGMPHRRADENLQVDEDRRCRRQPAERRIVHAASAIRVSVPGDPSRRREQRDRDGHAEEDLGEASVRRRHRIREEEQDRDAAEDALRDHGAECRDAEPAEPAAPLRQPQPDGQDDREEAHRARDEAVSMLVEDVRDPHRRREREHVPAVAGGPVGHRQAGIVAGHEAAGKDQDDRAGGHELGKPVETGAGRHG